MRIRAAFVSHGASVPLQSSYFSYAFHMAMRPSCTRSSISGSWKPPGSMSAAVR
jgi:hypothetical protein